MTQAEFSGASIKRQIPYYCAFNVPWLGTLDIEVNGVTRGDTFFDASYKPGNRYVELWAGPIWACLERNGAIRPKRGTLAVLALAVFAAAGWTEGHLWHLPFLG